MITVTRSYIKNASNSISTIFTRVYLQATRREIGSFGEGWPQASQEVRKIYIKKKNVGDLKSTYTFF